MEQTCRIFHPFRPNGPSNFVAADRTAHLSFPELAARWHCRENGIEEPMGGSWKRALLPLSDKPRWDDHKKHPSVVLKSMDAIATVKPSYSRGTYMTVFESQVLNLGQGNTIYTLTVRIGADTTRAGLTLGILDPAEINPCDPAGCELCQARRGWGVFVCKGSKDKFTNGLYHAGEYIGGGDSEHIKGGWRKDDLIEIWLKQGELQYKRNGHAIPEVTLQSPEIHGKLVFALTLYNSRLEVEAVGRSRTLQNF